MEKTLFFAAVSLVVAALWPAFASAAAPQDGASALEREVERLYALATGPHSGRHAQTVRQAHREWQAQREACRGRGAPQLCDRDLLLRRMALLRATSKAARLKDDEGISSGPFAWRCEGIPGLVITTYANAEVPLVWLTRGGKSQALEQQRTASGTRFSGGGVSIWEHQGEALFQDNASSRAVKCAPEKIA